MSKRISKSLQNLLSKDLPNLKPINNTIGETANDTEFKFLGLTLTMWIILILALALLGINVFTYLAQGTQETVNIFNQVILPILQWFGYTTLESTKQTIETSAIGTKAGVDLISDTATSSIEKVQDTITQGTESWMLEETLNKSSQNSRQQTVVPDEATTSTTTKTNNWCFIGEENGNRVCAELGPNVKCMSNQVFATQELCNRK
jgi:hypothetical protein